MREKEKEKEVINLLSEMILRYATMGASEQYVPNRDVDRSDSIIRECKDQVKKLREMRETFENMITGNDY